jgi:hypothetical protein
MIRLRKPGSAGMGDQLERIRTDLSCEINRRSVLLYACLMRSDGR